MSNLQSNSSTTQTDSTGVGGIGGQQSGMGTTSSTGMGGGGDMLDKGVNFLAGKAGHEQVIISLLPCVVTFLIVPLV